MLKEFVEKIVALAGPKTVEIKGLNYCERGLSLVEEPGLDCVETQTLTGLVDVVKAGVDNLVSANYLLVVEDHVGVSLVHRTTDVYGRRIRLARAALADGQPFPFGRFVDREEFVIGLQSQFAQRGDVLEVLKLASNLTVSQVAQSEDDGIAQRTTVKQGIALKENVTVKGRVTLHPFRTFREIEQPGSEFVFRLRSKDGAVPECALFEADGGKWKLDAVLAIKRWLEAQWLNIPVIA